MTTQKSVTTLSRHTTWTGAALALSLFAFGCQPEETEPKTEEEKVNAAIEAKLKDAKNPQTGMPLTAEEKEKAKAMMLA